LPLQYLNYLGSLLRLDLGSSITDQGRDVWSVIQQYFPATVELAAFSMALIMELALVCFPHRDQARFSI